MEDIIDDNSKPDWIVRDEKFISRHNNLLFLYWLFTTLVVTYAISQMESFMGLVIGAIFWLGGGLLLASSISKKDAKTNVYRYYHHIHREQSKQARHAEYIRNQKKRS